MAPPNRDPPPHIITSTEELHAIFGKPPTEGELVEQINRMVDALERRDQPTVVEVDDIPTEDSK